MCAHQLRKTSSNYRHCFAYSLSSRTWREVQIPPTHWYPDLPLQVEFADVVLLNKVDLAAPSDLAQLRAMLGSLNPGARLLETTRCTVNLTEVLHSQRYSVERASEAAGWQQVSSTDHGLIYLG